MLWVTFLECQSRRTKEFIRAIKLVKQLRQYRRAKLRSQCVLAALLTSRVLLTGQIGQPCCLQRPAPSRTFQQTSVAGSNLQKSNHEAMLRGLVSRSSFEKAATRPDTVHENMGALSQARWLVRSEMPRFGHMPNEAADRNGHKLKGKGCFKKGGSWRR